MNLKKSITAQLLRTIFGLYFLVALTVTGIQLALEYQHVEDSITTELKKFKTTYGPGITDSLWTFNDELLRSILQGMRQNNVVVGVSVDAQQEGFDHNVGNTRSSEHAGLFGYTFSLTHNDGHHQVRDMGKVTVYSSSAIVIDRVKHGFWLILINAVIKTAALWLLFIYFMNRILGRPLASISSQIAEIRPGRLVEVRQPGGHDNELRSLTQAFNDLIGRLRNAYESVNKGETALRKSEDMFRSTFESASHGMVILDANGNRIRVNSAYCWFVGYDPSDLLGDSPKDNTHPDDVEKQRQLRAEQVAGHRDHFQLEKRYIHATGTIKWGLLSSSVVRDDLGRISYTVNQIIDITQEKAAEEALRKSESHFRQIFEEAGHGLILADVDTRIVQANPAMCDMLGYAEADILNTSIMDLTHHDDRKNSQKQRERLINGKISKMNDRRRLLNAGGDVVWCEFSAGLLRDESGNPQYVIGQYVDISKQVRIENAVQESEARLRAVLDGSPMGITLKDLDGRYLTVNETFARWQGSTPAAMTGKKYENVADDTGAAVIGEYDKRLLQTGEPIEDTIDITFGDGRNRRIYFHKRPICSATGEIIAIATTVQNITALIAAHDALRESETRFKTLYNGSPIMMHSLDSKGRLLSVNDHWLKSLGYERDEVIGRLLPEFYTDEGRRYARDVAIPQTFREGYIHEVPYQMVKKNGEIIDVLLSATMAKDESNDREFTMAVIVDVTEQRKAENELKFSESLLRTILDSSPSAIAMRDDAGKYLIVNDTYAEWWGTEKSTIVGRHPQGVISNPEVIATIEKTDELLQDTEQDIRSEDTFAFADGVVRSVIFDKRPIRSPNGEELGHVINLTDISDLKQAEQALAEANDRLEERVEDRTRELRAAQGELLRNERLAALGQLTGTVAHELRNPLATIATSAAVVTRKTKGSGLDLEAATTRINRNVDRCDTIITELLDFARAKGLEPVSTRLDSWLSNLVSELEVPPGIKLERHLETENTIVQFDQDRLRRAVINLIDNAGDAMRTEDETGQGEIRVTTRAIDGRVEIEVADTGPGIPDDVLPQIYEPLFSTKTFGVGLGLPTVRRIMDEHGGGLEISSETTKGTRAVLWLPMNAAFADKELAS